MIDRLNAALEGRYRIEKQIGEGGMSTVYLADDLKHNRKVALKVLKPELAAVVGADRFLAEIETTANLQHPHILPLFDSGEADGFLFFVMPFIDGETLADKIEREKQLPVDEAVGIATAVASALSVAHEQGVIHRDIKPGNVLLSRGEPLVSDFGIAIAVTSSSGARLTETGLSVGTPYYMSPEQATGDREVAAASDVYSLGCVLYEMLVGEPPYVGNTAQAVLGKILTEKPRDPSKVRAVVPPHVEGAVLKALEKLPADRFTSASGFVSALRDSGFRYGDTASTQARAGAGLWKPAALGFGILAVAASAFAITGLLTPPPAPPVERFALEVPEVTDALRPNLVTALLPDGSGIVYGAMGADGFPHLLLRRWEDLASVPIPGTDGLANSNPVVSPDGTEVAFRAGTQLLATPIQGGITRTLADSASCCMTWGEDGFIYFSPLDRGIQRVPAGGGPVERVTTRDGGTHGYFHPIPGTDRGLMTVYDNPYQIVVVDTGDGSWTSLLPGARSYLLPSGHLVVGREEGGIVVAPFDAKRLELTGPAVPIVEGSAVTPAGSPTYTVSTSGSLLYWTGGATSADFELVWMSRDGAAIPVQDQWAFDPGEINLSWVLSPAGDRIAFKARTEVGTDIWIKSLTDGVLSRLTFHEAEDRFPWWSPDGEEISFISSRNGSRDLWTRAADGTGEATLLLDMEEQLAEARRSPDGEWLLLRAGTSGGPIGARNVYALRLGEDSVPRALTATPNFDETAPALSPDGRWLAYVSDETGTQEVFVRPFPNVDDDKVQVSTGGGRGPVWANNGTELFYLALAGAGPALEYSPRDLVATEFRTEPRFSITTRRTLFTIPAGYYHAQRTTTYEIAPGDQRFLMARLAGSGEEEGASRLILVQNWIEEVKARLGGGAADD